MALQALAKYQDQSAVQTATENALACLSGMQDEDGGFSSWDGANSESCVQVIVALCELGIELNDSMSRAGFAAVAVRALGLPAEPTGQFADVPPDQWYAPYVGAAYRYGIVNGKTATAFVPAGTISWQEAAVMAARAAKLCGMDTDMDAAAVQNTLAQFGDYRNVSEWARPALAFCYQAELLDQSDLNVRSGEAVKRREVAQMLFNLLESTNLL